MGVKEDLPKWFTEESEANQAYLAGIEWQAKEYFTDGFVTFSAYLSKRNPTFFDKLVRAISGSGWDLNSVTTGREEEEALFVIFKRASPSRSVDSVEDMEGQR